MEVESWSLNKGKIWIPANGKSTSRGFALFTWGRGHVTSTTTTVVTQVLSEAVVVTINGRETTGSRVPGWPFPGCLLASGPGVGAPSPRGKMTTNGQNKI